MDIKIAVIIGAPGAGKTTQARAVAHQLGAAVVDQDTVMGPLVAVALTAAGLGPAELDSPYFVKHPAARTAGTPPWRTPWECHQGGWPSPGSTPTPRCSTSAWPPVALSGTGGSWLR